MGHDDLLGMDELAERAGVSRRTVRYYVQRGLLPPPQGLGRGKHYAASHLATLIRIRELQEQGVPLDAIAAQLAAPPAAAHETAFHARRPVSAEAAPPPAQATWTRVNISDDTEVHLRGRRLTDDQIRKLARAINAILKTTPEGTS